MQEQPKETKIPLIYWSRTMTAAEEDNITTLYAFLAVVYDVLLLRPYLKGQQCAIRIGHDGLKWILFLTDATAKSARGLLHLSEARLDVLHRFGIKRQAADALLGPNTGGTDTTYLDDDF